MKKVFEFVTLRPPEALSNDEMGGKSISLPIPNTDEIKRYIKLIDRLEDQLNVNPSFNIEREDIIDVELALSTAIRQEASFQLINKLSNIVKQQRGSTLLRGGGLPLMGNDYLAIGNYAEIIGEAQPISTAKPSRKAHFGPVGVADLKLVEEHLKGYELGEIAYIENVMASESRERIHRVSTVLETTVIDETESETLSERDLQTAERFQLQTAARSELESRSELDTGLEVNGKYGPTVEVTAKLDYSLTNSKSQARERASSFAKDVIDRSVERTQERVRQQREEIRRVATEHVNTHGFDNTNGTEHITGIYRYVDKIMEMRLVNKGKRFFYEFIIPEPGTYLRFLTDNKPKQLPKPPNKPMETISNITPNTYISILKKYNLTGIKPPPQGTIIVAETFGDGDDSNDGSQRFRKEGNFVIDDGYKAVSTMVKVIAFKQHTTDPEVWVTVGDKTVGRADGWPGINASPSNSGRFSFRLSGQRKALSYQVYTRHDATVQVSIEVTCEPTEEAILEWRHSVYDAIQDRYQQQLSEYAAQVAEASAFEEVQAFSEPPLRLREMERTELKRMCLQLLGQEAQLVTDPLNEGDVPLVVENGESPLDEGPSISLDLDNLETLAPEIRFGEQAFEWANMSFFLYPYYWARPNQWSKLAVLQHSDAQHAAFLRAGSARVLVSVRTSFLDAVQGFLKAGRRALEPLGNVDVGDPLWLPLHEEIKAAQNVEDAEVESTWEVKLPTTLVMLDKGDALPKFPLD